MKGITRVHINSGAALIPDLFFFFLQFNVLFRATPHARPIIQVFLQATLTICPFVRKDKVVRSTVCSVIKGSANKASSQHVGCFYLMRGVRRGSSVSGVRWDTT